MIDKKQTQIEMKGLVETQKKELKGGNK